MGDPGLPLSTRPPDGDGSSNQLLQLAVFVLLLGFFILMNALSTYEEQRVGAVLESVDGAFSAAADPAGEGTDRQRAAALADAARALADLGDLVMSEIELAKLDQVGTGDTLALNLPAQALFAGTELRADRVALLNRIATILLPRPAGVQVRLEALVAARAGAAEADGLTRQAGSLARGLVATGAPAGALSIGIERGEPGSLRLLFTVEVDRRPVRLTADGRGTP